MSVDENHRPTDDELPSLKEFLLAAPDLGALVIHRPPEPAQVVGLATPAGDIP